MNPTQSDVHVNVPLTQLTVGFSQDAKDFVSMTVFPPVPVDNKSDVFYKFKREDFFRDSMKPRAPGTIAESSGYDLETGNYNATDFALAHPIPDAIRRNADKMINLDYSGTQFLTGQALLNREVNWGQKYFSTGLWTNGKTGNATEDGTHVVYWDAEGSTPIEDVLAGKATIKQNTGYDANVLVLGYQTHQKLKTNAQIIDRLKYGSTQGPVKVTNTDLAQLFEVERVVVMGAIQTTSAKGAATPTFGFIGGKHALLAYAAPAPGLMVPSAGYTFNWQGLPNSVPQGWRIKKYRVEEKASDILEVEQAYDHGLVSNELGYFFASVVQ